MGTNYIDNLLSKIDDESLRTQLTNEFNKLRDNKEFGLVFERHIPEYVRLHKREITEGAHVQLRSSRSDDIFTVREIKGKTARIADKDDSMRNEKIDDLVVVIRHGDSIYPGLVEVDRVERGGGKPFHTVINAENYHALQLLLYTHERKIDCIYIDPPYNNLDKSWKYNNHYVDSDDKFKHSKWLSFMEKRLLFSKKLLKENSALVVAIDENEVLNLGILLRQIFPSSKIQMISTIIKPEGTNRKNEFSRTNEFLFIVMNGDTKPIPHVENMFDKILPSAGTPIEWRMFRRREKTSTRNARPNQFYAVHIDRRGLINLSEDELLNLCNRAEILIDFNDSITTEEKKSLLIQELESRNLFASARIHSIGDELDINYDITSYVPPVGTEAVFPLKPDGTEMLWGLTPASARKLLHNGHIMVETSASKTTVKYLAEGTIAAIDDGDVEVTGRNNQSGVIGHFGERKVLNPKSVWNKESHNAQTSGSLILKKLIGDNDFPFPKSLYAVEDVLSFFVRDNPNAVVLDYFGGSGTTTHAVIGLNQMYGGNRKSILISNNEMSNEEEKSLRKMGFDEQDEEFTSRGIFNLITMPRIKAAVSGHDWEGNQIDGKYAHNHQIDYSDGFSENVIFFELEYLNQNRISRNTDFKSVCYLLWEISGSIGEIIQEITESYSIQTDGFYGVLFNIDYWGEFVKEVKQIDTITHAFIVTDSRVQYQQVVKHLPTNIQTTMLYEDYLRNFQIGV